MFEEYLQSFMGGKLKPDISKKHRQNTQRILEIYDPFLESTHMVGEAVEANITRGIWKPNTARTYMQSFKTFLTFVGTMIVSQHPSFKSIDAAKLEILKSQIGRIGTTLTTMVVKEKKAFGEKVEESSINPKDLQMYLKSDRAKEAKDVLESNAFVLTRETHTVVRNYLIMRIATSNAHIAACISNMTVNEFEKAKSVNADYLVYVHQHKTAKTFGPAEVVLTSDVFRFVSLYKQSIRPASSTQELFIAWSGQKMDSSGILNCFATELAHVGVEKK